MVALTLNLLVGAGIYLHSAQAAEKDSPYDSLQLFSYVLEKVRKDYVDGQKLGYQDLVYGALKGMVARSIHIASFLTLKSTKNSRVTPRGNLAASEL